MPSKFVEIVPGRRRASDRTVRALLHHKALIKDGPSWTIFSPPFDEIGLQCRHRAGARLVGPWGGQAESGTEASPNHLRARRNPILFAFGEARMLAKSEIFSLPLTGALRAALACALQQRG